MAQLRINNKADINPKDLEFKQSSNPEYNSIITTLLKAHETNKEIRKKLMQTPEGREALGRMFVNSLDDEKEKEYEVARYILFVYYDRECSDRYELETLEEVRDKKFLINTII